MPGVRDAGAEARDDRMRYRRPSRLRRIAKWIGLGVCVVMVGLSLVSFWCRFGYQDTRSFAPCWICEDDRKRLLPYRIGCQFRGGYFIAHVYHSPKRGQDGWIAHPGQFYIGWRLVLGVNDPHPAVFIPFWMPLIAIVVPTAILWHRDRRPRKGHCPHCGYNLTGNESGVCPECSTPVPKHEATA